MKKLLFLLLLLPALLQAQTNYVYRLDVQSTNLNVNGTNVFQLFGAAGGSSGIPTLDGTGSNLVLKASGTTNIPLKISGITSQTSPLIYTTNVSGTVEFGVGVDGNVTNAGSMTIGGGAAVISSTGTYRTVIGGVVDNFLAGSGNNAIGGGSDASTVGGGVSQTIGANVDDAVIAGGSGNTISSGTFGTIGGGQSSSISAAYGIIPGGSSNSVTSTGAVALGNQVTNGTAYSVASGFFTNATVTYSNGNMLIVGTVTNVDLTASKPMVSGSGKQQQSASLTMPTGFTVTDPLAVTVTPAGTVSFNVVNENSGVISNTITSYNGQTTAGNGMASIPGAVALLGATDLTTRTTTAFTSPTGITSTYFITYYLVVTTAGSSGTVTVAMGWQDENAIQSLTVMSVISLSATGFSAGGVGLKTTTAHAISNTPLTYTLTFSGVTGNPVYNLYINYARLQ